METFFQSSTAVDSDTEKFATIILQSFYLDSYVFVFVGHDPRIEKSLCIKEANLIWQQDRSFDQVSFAFVLPRF